MLQPYQMCPLSNELKVKMTPSSVGCRMHAVLVGMKATSISLYISIRAVGLPGALSVSSSILKGIFFSEQ